MSRSGSYQAAHQISGVSGLSTSHASLQLHLVQQAYELLPAPPPCLPLQYPDACGRCLWVKGSTGKPFIVRVINDCPFCALGEVDLSAVVSCGW